MSKVEKITILGSLGSALLISAYYLLKPYAPKFDEAEDGLTSKRKRVINNPNMRVLYSSMSFFYLQGYESGAKNLFLLKDVLDVAKPKMVALQLSETDYNAQYLDVVKHIQFSEVMKKVDYLVKIKDEDKLNNLRELDINKGIENLFVVNYCKQNGCKVIFADEPYQSYQDMLEAKLRVKQITKNEMSELFDESEVKESSLSEEQLRSLVFETKRAEVYVDRVMKELKPKFSLIPDTPYKVIVGVVNKATIDEVVRTWKSKFLSVYGHQIVEDDETQLQ